MISMGQNYHCLVWRACVAKRKSLTGRGVEIYAGRCEYTPPDEGTQVNLK